MHVVATLLIAVLGSTVSMDDDMRQAAMPKTASCAHECPVALMVTRRGQDVVRAMPVAVVERAELLA